MLLAPVAPSVSAYNQTGQSCPCHGGTGENPALVMAAQGQLCPCHGGTILPLSLRHNPALVMAAQGDPPHVDEALTFVLDFIQATKPGPAAPALPQRLNSKHRKLSFAEGQRLQLEEEHAAQQMLAEYFYAAHAAIGVVGVLFPCVSAIAFAPPSLKAQRQKASGCAWTPEVCIILGPPGFWRMSCVLVMTS